MDDLRAKTLEEHREYLAEILRLKLWFVYRWLAGHPEEDLPFVLRWRVDIYRKSLFWRGRGFPATVDFQRAGWSVLERQIQTLHEQTCSDVDSSRFEREAFEYVWGVVEPNAFHDYQTSLANKGFQCESLGYDPPKPENPRVVPFHITNAVQPHSVFDDRTYLPKCFFCLMDKAETEFNANALGTGTWMNSHPRWLELFPEEYLDNMGPREEAMWCGLGYWGQFVSARGTLNRKRVKAFRETGSLPYPWRTSWCSFEAMRAHLRAYLDGLARRAA